MGLLSTIGAASGRAFGLTRVGVLKDLYFNLTTLLLPGNGTNGAQNNTFTDSSSNGFGITRNPSTGPNAPTQGTFSPFSQTGWSGNFNTSTTYLTVTDTANLRFGSSNFTIEAWVYRAASGAIQTIASKGASTPTGWVFQISAADKLVFTDTSTSITGATTLNANTWYYVAVVRAGTGTNQTTLYVNAASDATGTSSTNFNQTNNMLIGADRSTANFANGYISNLRLSNTNRTISSTPTSALTADANTIFLALNSNWFQYTDSTAAYTAMAVTGTPSVQAFSPFAPTAAYSAATVGGSGYFDGTGDSLASTTDFEASTSTSTFTIEGFIYPTTFSTLINIIGGMVVSSGDAKSIAAEVNTSGQVALYWFDGAIKRCTGNTVMQLNAWNYFAIVVNSNAISIYVNKTTADTLSGTTTLTNRTILTTLGVGAYYNNNTPAQYFNGYLSNIRVSTVARTISAVPTAPLTSDANVRWLFNFTNAGITDATAKNVLETVGGAQINTTQSKFGGSSMYFDGTGDYLIFPNSQNFALGSGDFTVEAWVFVAASKLQAIMDTRAVNTNTTGIALAIDASNFPYVYVNNATLFTSSTAITLNTWTHLAMVRSSGTITLYINGTKPSTGSAANTTNLTDTALTVGSVIDYRDTTATLHFNGYIDDLRITKGFARYTANFTAPTAALPLQ